MTKTHEVFFTLVRTGLWEKDCALSSYGHVDFNEVYTLAGEQSVIGLVAAGLEHITDVKVPKNDILPFLTNVLVLEQQNEAMDAYIAETITKLRKSDIYALLLKGQGLAQCYARPKWRACGDIDLFLDSTNYEKAKQFFTPLATSIEKENKFKKDLDMTVGPWTIELHGTMNTQLARRINKGIEAVQRDIFVYGGVRAWMNGRVDVFLPNADNDIILVFTHFLNHFFIGGVGLRQICDWCRLIWTYKEKIDVKKLETRLKDMGIMFEWRAFAAFAVEYLGMPIETIPFYKPSKTTSRKARRICRIVLDAGNFGHNKDNSYRSRYKGIKGHLITLARRTGDFFRLATIFPIDAPKFFLYYLTRRVMVLL